MIEFLVAFGILILILAVIIFIVAAWAFVLNLDLDDGYDEDVEHNDGEQL